MKRLVYINPDCYLDVDLSVLRYLAQDFELIWYPVYYTDREIYYTPEEMTEYAERYGIELHRHPRLYRQRDPRNYGFYTDIVREVNARGVDLVYSCITEELYWTLASRKLKATRVLGLHDVLMHSFGAPVKRFIQTRIRELTIRESAHVCVFSENQAELFRRRHGRTAETLGLACRDLGPTEMTVPPISQGVRLLFFGNIVEYKGLDLLIAAIERLREAGVDKLTLTIAGKGDYWNRCKPLIKTENAYRLEVRFIANEELPDLLASHHFLALPYRNATQSGPLALAAGYGVPILAPDFGCFREQYDRQSAVLYDDLDTALRQLASMSQEDYDAMKNNALSLKERFSEESLARKYVRFFKQLCG